MVYCDCLKHSQARAHLWEEQSFNAGFFFFHTNKTRRKKPFCIFFLLGGQKERPGSQRPPIETVLQKSRPHVRPPAVGDERTCRCGAGRVNGALEWPCARPALTGAPAGSTTRRGPARLHTSYRMSAWPLSSRGAN